MTGFLTPAHLFLMFSKTSFFFGGGGGGKFIIILHTGIVATSPPFPVSEYICFQTAHYKETE